MVDVQSLINRNRAGEATGLPCFCTANEQVLRAVMQYVARHEVPAVIEATCNQVNQEGGYTGMTPDDFARWMKSLMREYKVPRELVMLGGDHLGPNPWRHLDAESAMQKAEVLVHDYAAAGFRKIHLDASMACGSESTPSFDEVAERAARLCAIAESAARHPGELVYIIGTEVPIPGGETDDMDGLSITSVARLQETIDTHMEAFDRHALSDVWTRIVAVVTQPGVDFSHTRIHRFEPARAASLSDAILDLPGLCFEAHSTDYQPTEALAELVRSHFFFLKVGPELTFRMREAVFALAAIERALVQESPSDLIAVVDAAMDAAPSNWQSYYQGEANTVRMLRHYSYSDRIRYYWAIPEVKVALERLIANLEDRGIPDVLISQHFPTRRFGALSASPTKLLEQHVELCLDRYYRGCGY